MPRKQIRGNVSITGDLAVGDDLAVAGDLTVTGSFTHTSSEFVDNAFAIKDNVDETKKFSFQASGVTAGQNRVLTVPDFNGTLATLAGTETLTNKTLTTPKIGIIHDTNGNEALEMTAAASAVNQPEFVNAATTKPVELKTKGGDADIAFKLTAKGYAPIMLYGPVADYTDPTTVNDASDQAIASAAVVKKLYLRDCNGGARQDTLPAAAALVAAFPGAYVGLSFIWICKNASDANETLTLAAPDAAVTIVGTATVAQNNTKLFLIRLTNVTAASEAYTAYSLGTLTH